MSGCLKFESIELILKACTRVTAVMLILRFSAKLTRNGQATGK